MKMGKNENIKNETTIDELIEYCETQLKYIDFAEKQHLEEFVDLGGLKEEYKK